MRFCKRTPMDGHLSVPAITRELVHLLAQAPCGTPAAPSLENASGTALHPVRILPFHFRFVVPMAELDHRAWDRVPRAFRPLNGLSSVGRRCSHLCSYEWRLLAATFLSSSRRARTRDAAKRVSGLSSVLRQRPSGLPAFLFYHTVERLTMWRDAL